MNPNIAAVLQALVFATSVVGVIGANILAGYFVGGYLDVYFGTGGNTLRLVFSIGGVFTAFMTIYKMIKNDLLLPSNKKHKSGKDNKDGK